jgi:hypothetical protein
MFKNNFQNYNLTEAIVKKLQNNLLILVCMTLRLFLRQEWWEDSVDFSRQKFMGCKIKVCLFKNWLLHLLNSQDPMIGLS